MFTAKLDTPPGGGAFPDRGRTSIRPSPNLLFVFFSFPYQGVDEDLGSFLALVERIDVRQLLQQVHHCDGDMCSALRRNHRVLLGTPILTAWFVRRLKKKHSDY